MLGIGIRSPRSGYMSARTKQIRFATMTLVLGYHHPLAIVKRYGTLDHVSGGRVILGVGVGSLKEEFDLLGAPFDDRGARGDDALRALRAALPSNEPAYDGEYYSYGGLTVDPCALQPHMPIWVGGRTRRIAAPRGHARRWLVVHSTFRSPPRQNGCKRGSCLTTSRSSSWPEQPLDPVGKPESDAERWARWPLQVRRRCRDFIAHSLEHYLEQIHALAELHGLNGTQA